MKVHPEHEAFAETYRAGCAQVVWTTLVADLETPVSAFLKLAQDRPNSFLFESVEGGANIGRYSFLGCRPDLIWRCFGERAEINRKARYDAGSYIVDSAQPKGQMVRTLLNEQVDMDANWIKEQAG